MTAPFPIAQVETVKFCSPPHCSRFLLHLHPLPHRSENRAVLTLAYQGLGQPGESVRAKRHRAQPAGKRIAQARDRLIERAVRMLRVVDSSVLREAESFWSVQKECLEWTAKLWLTAAGSGRRRTRRR